MATLVWEIPRGGGVGKVSGHFSKSDWPPGASLSHGIFFLVKEGVIGPFPELGISATRIRNRPKIANFFLRACGARVVQKHQKWVIYIIFVIFREFGNFWDHSVQDITQIRNLRHDVIMMSSR